MSKIFFSYSRANGEFVLRLARDLREAGASLWLDQLDIAGGKRWDQAVEEALQTCEMQIVVLSPSAVSSQNVMDEVSFALEEGKQVIPVVCEECDVPFRLRRVQRIGFTDDYNNGFRSLLAALKLEGISQPIRDDQPPAPAGESPGGPRQGALVGPGLAALPVPQAAVEIKPPAAVQTKVPEVALATSPTQKRNMRMIVAMVATVLVVGAGGGFLTLESRKAAEEQRVAAEQEALADRAAEDKAAADKATAEKKALADKTAADRALAERAALDKALADARRTAQAETDARRKAEAESDARRKAEAMTDVGSLNGTEWTLTNPADGREWRFTFQGQNLINNGKVIATFRKSGDNQIAIVLASNGRTQTMVFTSNRTFTLNVGDGFPPGHGTRLN